MSSWILFRGKLKSLVASKALVHLQFKHCLKGSGRLMPTIQHHKSQQTSQASELPGVLFACPSESMWSGRRRTEKCLLGPSWVSDSLDVLLHLDPHLCLWQSLVGPHCPAVLSIRLAARCFSFSSLNGFGFFWKFSHTSLFCLFGQSLHR